MKDLISYIAQALVDHPEQVEVMEDEGGQSFILELRLDNEDMGKIIGRSSLSKGAVGLQAGGQAYSEIIFFQDKAAFDSFKNGKLKLAAQASAVAVTAGASPDAAYEGGVAVFTMGKGGLMLQAAIGGQQLTFEPKPK